MKHIKHCKENVNIIKKNLDTRYSFFILNEDNFDLCKYLINQGVAGVFPTNRYYYAHGTCRSFYYYDENKLYFHNCYNKRGKFIEPDPENSQFICELIETKG